MTINGVLLDTDGEGLSVVSFYAFTRVSKLIFKWMTAILVNIFTNFGENFHKMAAGGHLEIRFFSFFKYKTKYD